MQKIMLWALLYMLCGQLYAQKPKQLHIQHPETGKEYIIKAGNKLQLAYHVDYYLQNPHRVNATVMNLFNPHYGKILYGSSRVREVTDSSLVFVDGTYAHFESLIGIRKLTAGKEMLRVLGGIASVTWLTVGTLSTLIAILVEPTIAIPVFLGTSAGVIPLLTSVNRTIPSRYIANWKMWVE